jgi:hypothetical protein
MRQWMLALVVLVVACSRQEGAEQNASVREQTMSPNELTDQERATGWQLLFDGSTTNGWRGYNQTGMPAGWQAVEGTLARVGQGGDIITTDQFDDFELSYEWKIGPGGNSGVFYRVAEQPGLQVYETGHEMQVLDNAGHADGKSPITSAGSNFALYAPNRDVTRPTGSWNTARIIVRDNHVEHWLNDVKILEFTLGSEDWTERVRNSKFGSMPRYGREPRGHIALQDHGDPVAYRNIRIRLLKG